MKKTLLIAFLFAAFSANAQDFVDSIPEWYNNPPVSTKVFYGVGAGTSRGMDIAEQKAILQGNVSLAEQAEPAKVKEIKNTSKSTGGKTSEEVIQQKIVEANLKDVKLVKKVYMQNGDTFTVYVLLEMKKKR